ncbi:MAG TPA: hypothetical protein VM658_00665 [bacterium]|nr:hypothetical protein [bacterium]
MYHGRRAAPPLGEGDQGPGRRVLPLVRDVGKGGGFILSPGMLGANNLFVDLVEGVLREVEQKLSASHRGLIKDMQRKFYSAPWAPKDYTRHDDMLSDVIKAIVYQNVLKI